MFERVHFVSFYSVCAHCAWCGFFRADIIISIAANFAHYFLSRIRMLVSQPASQSSRMPSYNDNEPFTFPSDVTLYSSRDELCHPV